MALPLSQNDEHLSEWADSLASRGPMKQRGEIQLILGPMFAGKTTELLRRVRRYTVAKRKCVVVKYDADKRYSADKAATHDNYRHEAVSTDKIGRVEAQLQDAQVVAIDEGQFFPDLVEMAEDLANQGKIVVIAALDGTFQRQPFGRVLELIPLAERVTKLTSVCMACQGSAAFTSRLSNDTSVEVIGGADKYISSCRQCFKLSHDELISILQQNTSANGTAKLELVQSPQKRPGGSAVQRTPANVARRANAAGESAQPNLMSPMADAMSKPLAASALDFTSGDRPSTPKVVAAN